MKEPQQKIAAVIGSLATIATLGAGLAIPANAATQSTTQSTSAPASTAGSVRTVKVDGKDVTLNAGPKGWTAIVASTSKPSATLAVTRVDTDSSGKATTTTYDLKDSTAGTSVAPKATSLGGIKRSGSVVYTATAPGDTLPTTLTVNYTYQDGNAITLKDGSNAGAFVLSGDTWKASLPVTLGADNTPSTTKATLSDGTTADIAWGQVSTNATAVIRNGKATGTLPNGQKYEVDATATRLLTVTETRSVNVAGSTVQLSKQDDGSWTATSSITSKPSATLDVTRTVLNSGTSTTTHYTITGSDSHPSTKDLAFGVQSVTGDDTYTGKANDDPANTSVNVSYSYRQGEEITLKDGSNAGAFVLSGDTWKASLKETTLDSSNSPAVKNATLSDGTQLTFTYGDLASDPTTGTMYRAGTAQGTLPNGQKYEVDITARRDSAITKTSYTYSTTIGGVQYTGLNPKGSYADSLKPDDSITVSVLRTDTYEDGHSTNTTTTKDVTAKLDDTSVTRNDDIKQRIHKGVATYAASIGDDQFKAVFNYSYSEAVDYDLVINGKTVAFTKQPDGSWGIDNKDKPTLKLKKGSTNQLASGQTIEVNNDGTLQNVVPTGWGDKLTFTGDDGFTAANTFTISGNVEGASWTATLSATRPAEQTGQTTDNDRSVNLDGSTVQLSKQSDGSWTATPERIDSDPAKTLTVTATNHHLYENGKWRSSEDTSFVYDLGAAKRSDTATYPKFGITQHDGTQPYEGKADKDSGKTTVSVTYSYQNGKQWDVKRTAGDAPSELKVKGSPASKSSAWTLSDDEAPLAFTLTDKNKLEDGSSVTFVDSKGTERTVEAAKAKIDYGEPQIIDSGHIRIVKITGSFNGTLTTKGGDFSYTLPFTATRTYNDSITALRVTELAADGTTYTYDQSLANVKTSGSNEYAFTLKKLAYEHMANSFTVSGVDAGTDVTVTTSPAQRNDDGSLTFTVLAKSPKYQNTYEVSVPFAEAPVVPDASAAHLSDITINGNSIVDVNGNGFDPNRLAYTVKAKADAKVYILPVASAGVFVSAGDVTQNAGSSTYRWVVSQSGKKTTTYSVTVLRERDWKTADEVFTPKQPIAQEGTVVAGKNDTDLQSHGYVDATGAYVRVAGDAYTIPQGGTFSYQAKSGQVAVVTTAKVKGMTYRYTVNVAAPGDLSRFVQHVFTVTYITPATQVASLTGIKVNGKAIVGFDASKHDYTVAVASTDQWTIVPQFDERTGATVTTHKDGVNASITVTSADGLVNTTYAVHVVANGKGRGSVGVLAQTGSSVLPLTIGAIVLLALGGVGYAISRRRRTKK